MTAFTFERLDRGLDAVKAAPVAAVPRAKSVFARVFEAMVRSRQAQAERIIAQLDLRYTDRIK